METDKAIIVYRVASVIALNDSVAEGWDYNKHYHLSTFTDDREKTEYARQTD